MARNQKIRPLGLRAKILSIIAVSVVIPLVTGTLVTRFQGFRAYRNEKGALFKTIATHYAMGINAVLDGHARSLQEWAALSPFSMALAQMTRGPTPDQTIVDQEVAYWDSRWPGPQEGDASIQEFLTNEVARLARRFMAANPEFGEILVTDMQGRLIGATGRTEDYFQAEESWWRGAERLRGRQVWVEGVYWDPSAGIDSLAMSLVIFDPEEPGRAAGVIKGVLEASQVLGPLQPILDQEQPISRVVLGDGTVIGHYFELGTGPGGHLPPAFTQPRTDSQSR